MSEDKHLEMTIATIESDLLPIAKAAASYDIVDSETMEGGINFLGKIKSAHDRVETTRKFFTAPLLELKKRYDAKFKPILDELEQAEGNLKLKMTDYRLTLPENSKKTETASEAKVTFVKTWKHRVVDMALVPREYMTPDDVKIAQVVKAGLRSIPGVEIYETEIARAYAQ